MADDGNRDVIRCGGCRDYACADLNDKAYYYCETVERQRPRGADRRSQGC